MKLTRSMTLLAAMVLAAAARADTLNVQLSADIRSSQPGVNRDALSDSVVLNVVEGLVAAGERGEIRPMLASTWDISADRTTYTFHLREGISFHNGSPFTAEDVKWSWDRLLAEKEHNCRANFDGSRRAAVTAISVVDPLTVTFTLDKPDEMFLNYMTQPQCGATAILHRSSFNADGVRRQHLWHRFEVVI